MINPISIRETFLSEEGSREMLKKMIKAKQKERSDILRNREKYINNKDLYLELHPETRQHFLELIFDQLKEGKFLTDINRDLRNMTWAYDSSQPDFEKRRNLDWERKYEQATRYVPIETVIHSLVPETKGKLMIKCPFHPDKTPSLKIYPKTRTWNCFGCGARGSPLDFVMQFHHLGFKEAVEYLSRF